MYCQPQQILLVPLTHVTCFGHYLVIVNNDLNMQHVLKAPIIYVVVNGIRLSEINMMYHKNKQLQL